MNKTELINAIADETELKKKDVTAIVNSVFDKITDSLARGDDRVTITNFGSFNASIVPAHKMETPLNGGSKLNVARTSSVLFKPADAMRDTITRKNQARKRPKKNKGIGSLKRAEQSKKD